LLSEALVACYPSTLPRSLQLSWVCGCQCSRQGASLLHHRRYHGPGLPRPLQRPRLRTQRPHRATVPRATNRTALQSQTGHFGAQGSLSCCCCCCQLCARPWGRGSLHFLCAAEEADVAAQGLRGCLDLAARPSCALRSSLPGSASESHLAQGHVALHPGIGSTASGRQSPANGQTPSAAGASFASP